MLKKFSGEIKIGIMVTAGLFMIIWGINFLKGVGLFSNQTVLYSVYENVDGLLAANPVQINGMQVGNVKTVEFTGDGSGRILVSYMISKDVRIPKNSKAKIISSNLMNAKAIDLLLGDSKESVSNGDTLESDIQLTLGQEVNRQVAPIRQKAESMMSSLDSVLSVIQSVFNPQTRENLSNSFVKIQSSLSALEHASFGIDSLVTIERVRFHEILVNFESISRNLKNNNENISNSLKNISTLTDTLAKLRLGATIANAEAVLDQMSLIVGKINRGEGSLGLLVNNDSLYNNLDATAKDLDLLVKDLNENPGRYVHVSVFGKKDKKPKPNKVR